MTYVPNIYQKKLKILTAQNNYILGKCWSYIHCFIRCPRS